MRQILITANLKLDGTLVAYYMTLNIHELAELIDSDQENRLSDSYRQGSPFAFDVPLTFMSENQDIYQRAISLLRRNRESVPQLWTSLNVTREQIESSWRNWVSLFGSWLRNVYGFSSYAEIHARNLVHHQDFFDML